MVGGCAEPCHHHPTHPPPPAHTREKRIRSRTARHCATLTAGMRGARSAVRCCCCAALVLVALLGEASAKRRGRDDDDGDGGAVDTAWKALKVLVAFSPMIGLGLFLFCSAFESKEKERLKRQKKHDFQIGDGTGD